MKVPSADIADRLSILILKAIHQGDSEEYQEYLNAFIDILSPSVFRVFCELLMANGKIWNLESAIRQGKEEQLGLEEVGRRALAIRDLNKVRVHLKNYITTSIIEGHKEVKIDHASGNA